MRHIILAVTNDLLTDHRVHKIATSLQKLGVSVTLVGRLIPSSVELSPRSYRTYRFKLPFRNGFLFYASYNLRLLLYLLTHKADIIVSNDLDTLAACFIASKLKGSIVVYDSHELFTEVPELINRPFVRNIWLLLEKSILPHIKYSYTVNKSIARIYSEKYNISMGIIRNLPLRMEPVYSISRNLDFPGKKIILYQGSLNVGRGLEMAIDSMQYIESAVLVIIGEGDISLQLHQRVKNSNLDSKVKFTGRIPMELLKSYTCEAFIGLSIEENIGLNYFYTLPNKLFDYIQARIPVIASNLPELTEAINKYKIGCIFDGSSAYQFASLINDILADENQYAIWKSNLERAAELLCWEKEEPELLAIFQNIL